MESLKRNAEHPKRRTNTGIGTLGAGATLGGTQRSLGGTTGGVDNINVGVGSR